MKKSQKKALKRTECPKRIRVLQRQERRRRKRNNDKTTKIEEQLLKTKYNDKGPAFCGSVNHLIKATKFSRQRVKHFVQTEPSYTKYKNVNQKNYDIDKIWSLDLAYVDKLASTTIMLNICLLQSTACMISQSATPDIKVCYYESKSVQSNDNDKKPEKSWDGQRPRV